MYTLSKQAEVDLIAIYDRGVAKFGVIQADKYFGLLYTDFERISKNPNLGRYRCELNCYSLPLFNHLILYEIQEGEQVYILAIVGGRTQFY